MAHCWWQAEPLLELYMHEVARTGFFSGCSRIGFAYRSWPVDAVILHGRVLSQFAARSQCRSHYLKWLARWKVYDGAVEEGIHSLKRFIKIFAVSLLHWLLRFCQMHRLLGRY